MQCPKCQTIMRERETEDVIIDICPSCGGVWLDAGELEKLRETEQRYYSQYDWDDDDDDDDDDRRDRPGRGSGNARRDSRYGNASAPRRKGFLSNIFESLGGGD